MFRRLFFLDIFTLSRGTPYLRCGACGWASGEPPQLWGQAPPPQLPPGAAPTACCPVCARALQPGFAFCPFCGTSLGG
ncbi:hypothetical protein TSOC_004061 [Tetrabaena socialis]|uniref:Zinc-ribbon 15 domain-containing protein n=1 Tax=Tetrabaena socialis TaxID=47790 RepID=A0A2J8A9X8_9CHLO|nr:hypothetical protein TSOC_004061 [Tetrabaena socialis]|eukprot:PNH09322.1 hypothetical protein TSOC_004061 [Tetrabaena socialis]